MNDFSAAQGHLLNAYFSNPLLFASWSFALAKLKSVQKMRQVKRAIGNRKTPTRLTDLQITLMQSTEKGVVKVKLQVTDTKEVKSLECEIIWT